LIWTSPHIPVRLLEEARLITNLVTTASLECDWCWRVAPRSKIALRAHGLPLLARGSRLAVTSSRGTRPKPRQYVINQLATVGGDAHRTFSDDALDAIHRASDGIPRLVNQLCDHALIWPSPAAEAS